MKAVCFGELLDGAVRFLSEATQPGMRPDDGLDQSLIAHDVWYNIAFD
jgi:hypothetical protein